MALASAWLWLQLIPLTGLASVSPDSEEGAGGIALLTLIAIPGTTAFIPLLIAALSLRAGGHTLALLALAAVALLLALAGISRIHRIDRWPAGIPTLWALGLLLIAAFPSAFFRALVLPVAQTVHSLPAGALLLSPLGFSSSGTFWPAPAALLLLAAGLFLLWRNHATLVPRAPYLSVPSGGARRCRGCRSHRRAG